MNSMNLKKVVYGAIAVTWVSGVAFLVSGVSEIEAFNKTVKSEMNSFRSKSANHKLVMSTFQYCEENRIDYSGCKVEIINRSETLGGRDAIEQVLSEVENINQDLLSTRDNLFNENLSARMASVFYSVNI